jgi:hypothetical protein
MFMGLAARGASIHECAERVRVLTETEEREAESGYDVRRGKDAARMLVSARLARCLLH